MALTGEELQEILERIEEAQRNLDGIRTIIIDARADSNGPGGGGSDPGTGGSDPGTGGSDPGTGGSDPGTGGSDPGTGG